MNRNISLFAKLSLLSGIAVAQSGCAANTTDAQLRRLATTVDAMRGRLQRQESRVEELSNRLFVLLDRVDSARVEAARAPTAPPLKVVRLVPEEPTPVEREVEEPPVVLGLDENNLPARLAVVDVPSPPPKPVEKKSPTKVRKGAERSFREALAAYRQGRVEQAHKRFGQFLRDFSTNAYADNARYWMGECRFDAKEYRKAISEFAKVLRKYPRSNKIPDALLKMGLSYERLGDDTKAKQAFEDLIVGYPKSALADLARTHVEKPSSVGGSR